MRSIAPFRSPSQSKAVCLACNLNTLCIKPSPLIAHTAKANSVTGIRCCRSQPAAAHCCPAGHATSSCNVLQHAPHLAAATMTQCCCLLILWIRFPLSWLRRGGWTSCCLPVSAGGASAGVMHRLCSTAAARHYKYKPTSTCCKQWMASEAVHTTTQKLKA